MIELASQPVVACGPQGAAIYFIPVVFSIVTCTRRVANHFEEVLRLIKSIELALSVVACLRTVDVVIRINHPL